MKVAIIVKPNNGCCFYRCVLPAEYIPWNKEKDKVKLFYHKEINIGEDEELADSIDNLDLFEPDIIFFNRNVLDKDIDWLKQQKKKGIKIIVDVDDYWELSNVHPVYNSWYKNKLNEIIQDNLKLADLVICTNEQLRQRVLPINKNCVIIPNAVPFGEKGYKQEKIKEEFNNRKVNFLYAGGSTHYPDISLLKGKFDRIGSDSSIKDNAIFTLAGFNPTKGNVHCQWDKMASVFKRTGSYQILDTLPLEEHMNFYDNADIVLVPLVNNQFNNCKSILKIVEASTRELLCIVSKVLPYTELINYPGIMWEDWITNIKYCIKNKEFVKDSGKQLAEKMKEMYDIRVWAVTRYQLFEHLLTK